MSFIDRLLSHTPLQSTGNAADAPKLGGRDVAAGRPAARKSIAGVFKQLSNLLERAVSAGTPRLPRFSPDHRARQAAAQKEVGKLLDAFKPREGADASPIAARLAAREITARMPAVIQPLVANGKTYEQAFKENVAGQLKHMKDADLRGTHRTLAATQDHTAGGDAHLRMLHEAVGDEMTRRSGPDALSPGLRDIFEDPSLAREPWEG
ncbi:MAG TPA: hypothetical protein VHA82_04980 [Ramlibacter sp.]|uniref:hypothetical protein n=1 Tax=Ramlibacter sp. TaxID=1917967 RepID=UPI002CAED7E2|nr:hypothetical protein [Ramlibacter sp.]HVZ43144.1 hypothetical protein [Ramlibacter sp.]